MSKNAKTGRWAHGIALTHRCSGLRPAHWAPGGRSGRLNGVLDIAIALRDANTGMRSIPSIPVALLFQ